ncbi:MAG: hypothetical protein ACODAB_08820 [Gemmatimonadota bacterium]
MNRSSAASVLALLAAFACGGSDGATNEASPDGADAAALEDSIARDSADSMRAGAADTGSASDPFTGFELEADPAGAVERRIPLLLRNQAARTAVVYADGGAGEVLLDSVPPGSDARVDILSRAATIALRSVAPDGELLRETEVSPGPDTIVDVIVGPAPATP